MSLLRWPEKLNEPPGGMSRRLLSWRSSPTGGSAQTLLRTASSGIPIRRSTLGLTYSTRRSSRESMRNTSSVVVASVLKSFSR